MEKYNYKGYQIEIYETYYGDDLYITKDGRKIYSARVIRGTAKERVKQRLDLLL